MEISQKFKIIVTFETNEENFIIFNGCNVFNIYIL